MKFIADSLSEAKEDYLEAILILSSKLDKVRPIDISKMKGVSKATVSVTLSILSKAGYVFCENPHSVCLTEKGKQVAESVLRKHKLLVCLLTKHLGIDEDVAKQSACRMEHAIGAEVADRLAKFIAGLAGKDGFVGFSKVSSAAASSVGAYRFVRKRGRRIFFHQKLGFSNF